MSGTSADGIDVALCRIDGMPPLLSARILSSLTIPYTPEQRRRILEACQPGTSDVESLCLLNADIGAWSADAIQQLLAQSGETADLIASHGQTVWHAVQSNGSVSATLQIGEASVIAERTGLTTISNFRARDVAAGGQGAPLTGYVDWLLLRHDTRWRAVQNIGGMANVSFLPPLSVPDAHPLVFDTGPGNALIDMAVMRLTNGAQVYDREGHIARYGEIDPEWLAELLTHPYFERVPPKTTGRELFGTAYAEDVYKEGLARGLLGRDIIATLTALTAHSISHAYERFAPARIDEVIIGGGGRHNPTLIAMMQKQLGIPVLPHEAIGINSDHKEALVFAVLAYETWYNRPGSLPSQTGARHPVVLGQITPGQNYSALIHRTWGPS
jgi:anhydro-N-acetylmuramic acid kinase